MLEPFKTALEFTLQYEGGYVNDKDDPGGETNMGISKRAHPDVDIKNLTHEQAALIYYRDYWAPAGCAALDAPVAVALFDFAVNSGVWRAMEELEQIHDPDPHRRAVKLCSARSDFLVNRSRIGRNDKYLKGWMRRVVALSGLVGGL